MGSKIPESVLVVIHTPDLRVLLLERADHPGFWQSVTGSKDSADEPLSLTCAREVLEETGIRVAEHRLSDWSLTNRYEIFPHWRHRYPEGVTHNTEHVFALQVPGVTGVAEWSRSLSVARAGLPLEAGPVVFEKIHAYE